MNYSSLELLFEGIAIRALLRNESALKELSQYSSGMRHLGPFVSFAFL